MRILSIPLLFLCLFHHEVFSQNTPEDQEKTPSPKYVFIGIGMGIPYGWNGVNVEVPLLKKLYISGGGGMMMDTENDWSPVGTDFNFGPSLHIPTTTAYEPAFRLLYGKVGFIYEEHLNKTRSYKPYNGWTFGLSNNFFFGKDKVNGFAIDFIYIAKSKLFEVEKNVAPVQRIKVGFGFKHRIAYK